MLSTRIHLREEKKNKIPDREKMLSSENIESRYSK